MEYIGRTLDRCSDLQLFNAVDLLVGESSVDDTTRRGGCGLWLAHATRACSERSRSREDVDSSVEGWHIDGVGAGDDDGG